MKNMFKKKFFLIPTLFFAAIVLAGCGQKSSLENVTPTKDDASIIFFYGKECPHCQAVEKYIADNQLDQKVQFSKEEIYHDKANAALAIQKAKECGISEDQLGVPFLWANGKCYEGETDVENFLNSQVK